MKFVMFTKITISKQFFVSKNFVSEGKCHLHRMGPCLNSIGKDFVAAGSMQTNRFARITPLSICMSEKLVVGP